MIIFIVIFSIYRTRNMKVLCNFASFVNVLKRLGLITVESVSGDYFFGKLINFIVFLFKFLGNRCTMKMDHQ